MRNVEGLTPLQARFVDEYLVDLNGSAAYRRAGYRARGNSAEVNAARLLRNAQVAAAVATRQQKLAAKLEISAEKVLQEYAKMAFSDLCRIATWDRRGVRYLGSTEVRDIDAAALRGIVADTTLTTYPDGRIEETMRLRLTLHSKTQALDSLAKHLNLFKAHQESALSPLMQALLESWPQTPAPYVPVVAPHILEGPDTDDWEEHDEDEESDEEGG